MKKIVCSAFTLAAVLALSACGSSDSANEEAAPDNVEMPAEEAMGNVDATPAVDASASASDAALSATDTAAAPSDAATAAESATVAAEKKL